MSEKTILTFCFLSCDGKVQKYKSSIQLPMPDKNSTHVAGGLPQPQQNVAIYVGSKYPYLL